MSEFSATGEEALLTITAATGDEALLTITAAMAATAAMGMKMRSIAHTWVPDRACPPALPHAWAGSQRNVTCTILPKPRRTRWTSRKKPPARLRARQDLAGVRPGAPGKV